MGSCRSLLIKFIHFGHRKPKRLSPNQLQSIEGFMSTSKIPNVEWQCLIKGVIRPFYSRLVELLVWQKCCCLLVFVLCVNLTRVRFSSPCNVVIDNMLLFWLEEI